MAGPARAGLVAYLAPPFAVGHGAALLGEAVGPLTGAGPVLVLAGSWLTARPPGHPAAAPRDPPGRPGRRHPPTVP